MASRKTDLEPTVAVASKCRKLITNWEKCIFCQSNTPGLQSASQQGLEWTKTAFSARSSAGQEGPLLQRCNWTLKSSKPTNRSGTKHAMHH